MHISLDRLTNHFTLNVYGILASFKFLGGRVAGLLFIWNLTFEDEVLTGRSG